MTTTRLGRRDIWSGAALTATGAAIALGSVAHRVGGPANPGPGFLGFYVGLAILAFGAAVAIGAWRTAEMPSLRASFRGMRSAPGMIIPMIVFCVLLERIGFLLSGFLVMWWLFAVAGEGPRSWRPPFFAVVATLATWLLFDRLLGSGLPGLPF